MSHVLDTGPVGYAGKVNSALGAAYGREVVGAGCRAGFRSSSLLPHGGWLLTFLGIILRKRRKLGLPVQSKRQ